MYSQTSPPILYPSGRYTVTFLQQQALYEDDLQLAPFHSFSGTWSFIPKDVLERFSPFRKTFGTLYWVLILAGIVQE